MVRARLWSATPQHSSLALSFEFLDWAEALLLECHIAVKDLCKALYFKCPHLVFKVSYQALHKLTKKKINFLLSEERYLFIIDRL